jgi:hypothetical protein
MEWCDPAASSVSEMFYRLIEQLDQGEDLLDPTIANALLTGIVASTQYFSNSKTTSLSMGVAAKLMSAGADQQLIAASINTPGFQSSDKKEKKHRHDEKNNMEEESASEPIITIPKSEPHRKEQQPEYQAESKEVAMEKNDGESLSDLPELPPFEFEELNPKKTEKTDDGLDSMDSKTDFGQVDEPALPPNPFMSAGENEDKVADQFNNDSETALSSINSNNDFTDSASETPISKPATTPEEPALAPEPSIDSKTKDDFNFAAPTLPEKEPAIQDSGMEQLDAAISTPATPVANDMSSMQEALKSVSFTDAPQQNDAVVQPENLNDASGLDAFFPPPPPPPITPTIPEPQLPNVSSPVNQSINSSEASFNNPSQSAAAEPPSISSFQIPDTGENESIFSDDNSN